MSEYAIEIENLWAGYDQEAVLEDVCLTVEEGGFLAIIGPNGGGKTTLLKVILGLLEPMRGRVRLFGQDVRRGRHWVGYVPQRVEMDQAFPICVWEVAMMGRLGRRGLFHRYTAQDARAVERALRDVEMWDLRDRPIGELSGGQKQRVYLARALAAEPRLLLLDEPTASIDPQVRMHIYELLRALNERVTIVLITHDVGVISAYVKTVGCLNRRLFYHGGGEVTEEMIENAYQCPIDLIAHGLPHRVFAEHPDHKGRPR